MTIDLLKQSAIPWSYTYKPPPQQISPMMLVTPAPLIPLFRWSSSFGSEDLFLILLWRKILYFFKPWLISGIKIMIKPDMSFKLKTIWPKKTHMDGNRDIWDCVGDPWNYWQFPVLFQSNGPIYLTWDNCSKKGEECPFHDCYIRLSTRRSQIQNKNELFKRLLIKNMDAVKFHTEKM